MASDRSSFALLSYRTENLGDEIQSIAARQFLPSTDLLIDRDNWESSGTSIAGKYKIILNGWFTHAPERWPPPPILDPLFVSFHITNEIYHLNTSGLTPAQELVTGESLAYLQRYQPIGARDLWTQKLLLQHGIQAYFSGCLTLALGQSSDTPRADYICAVDLDADLNDVLLKRSHDRIVRVAHSDPNGGAFEDRMIAASNRLSLYAHAKCVVTTRLHCALPCLALRTPVLLILTAPDRYRFSGLTELLWCCTVEQFINGKVDFNPKSPPPNKGAYLIFRDRLIMRACEFTGYLKPFQPAPLTALGQWLSQ
jgi:hypothetical protein